MAILNQFPKKSSLVIMDLDLDLEGTIGISSFFISAGIEQRIRYAEMDAKILTRINSVPEMQRYRPTQVQVSVP